MKQRVLGTTKLQISELGLGCMGMSECYGETNDAESTRTIHRALELGITHIDTADCYGFGHNEQLIGQAIKGRRSSVILASKCGFERDLSTGVFVNINGSPDYIKASCENSLRRLQTDYLDLLYLHRADPKTPIEDSMGALSQLVKAGKVRHIGLSEVCAETIARAHKVYPLTAVQSEYSLWHREPEQEIIPLCQALNIGFIAHGPIGKGFLTGTIKSIHSLAEDDLRQILPRFQDENITYNLSIISVLEEMANSKGCTVSQIALAWVLAQGEHIVAIPGTRKISHLEENISALSLLLSQEDLQQLSERIPIGYARGDLLPESFAKYSNH